jgi:tetratricopeptide (TPR) repeat protein
VSENTKSTLVDLGDDLLQTRTDLKKTPEPKGESPDQVESVEELLLNSKILVSEGLYEDAKKTLRHVLRLDGANLTARDRLAEIQKIEIKRLLGQDDGHTGGGFKKAKKKKSEVIAEDGDVVCAALERALGAEPTTEEVVFPNDGDREAFLKNIEVLCTGASAQDRIDLGIGFLEMEFYDAAIRLFQSAAHIEPGERRARALLATAWLAKGNGFEAMIEIESLVADQSAPEEERLDYGYLAGRAQDLLQNFAMAIRWYRAVLQIDPQYRDTQDRLRRSVKMMSNHA